MNHRRRAALFAAVFASSVIGAAMPASAETLGEAIAAAYESNPAILRQRSLLRSADEVFYRTERTLGPTVTAGAEITGDRTYDTNVCVATDPITRQCTAFGKASGSSRAGGLALDVSQPIYTGGRLSANIMAQEASLLASRESLRQAEATLVQSVVEAYVGVRRAGESLAIAEQNVGVLIRQRDEAKARFEVGASTRTDQAQAESRLASAQSSLIAQQNALENARAQYRTVVGRSPVDLAPEPSLATLLPASPGAAFQSAQLYNPTLRSAYLTERSSAAAISAARAARRPQVSVSVATDYTPNLFDQRQNTGVTGLARVTLPVFTGFTTGSNIRSAEETNRADNIAIESQIRSLQQQVTQAWNALQSARSTIVSSEEAVRASRLAFEGTREEQQVGLRTTLDLLNAEQELRNAEQTLINARFNEYTAAITLLNAMGRLEAKTFAPQIESYDPTANFDRVTGFGLPWEPLVRTIDRIGAAPIPQRAVSPGEVVPDLGGL